MMEAACTSETSVNIKLRTRQYIPKDTELYTCRNENLKSHTYLLPSAQQNIQNPVPCTGMKSPYCYNVDPFLYKNTSHSKILFQ
jgi:hypothetical protein